MFSKRDKIPTYGREKDGNPFWWIVSQAEKVRAERQPYPKLPAKPVRK